MINKQDVLNLIKDMKSRISNDLYSEADETVLDILLNKIEGMEEATDTNVGSKWISCSERLPDDRKEKLVYLSSDRITVAVYNEHRLPHTGCSIGWGYRVPDGYIDFENEVVIAWQPLPEPYREVK